jgi:hypothetical protein
LRPAVIENHEVRVFEALDSTALRIDDVYGDEP